MSGMHASIRASPSGCPSRARGRRAEPIAVDRLHQVAGNPELGGGVARWSHRAGDDREIPPASGTAREPTPALALRRRAHDLRVERRRGRAPPPAQQRHDQHGGGAPWRDEGCGEHSHARGARERQPDGEDARGEARVAAHPHAPARRHEEQGGDHANEAPLDPLEDERGDKERRRGELGHDARGVGDRPREQLALLDADVVRLGDGRPVDRPWLTHGPVATSARRGGGGHRPSDLPRCG